MSSDARGRYIPRAIHTKDHRIFEEKLNNPALSLTALLALDEQERFVNDDTLRLWESWEVRDGD